MKLTERLLIRTLKPWVERRIIGAIGEEPPAAPFIVTANHTSYFDHIVLAWWLLSHGRPYPKFLSKSELFDSPLSAWLNRRGGGIPVERNSADTDAFDKASQVLADGGVLIMYAEGTRSRDGWLRAPRRGLATLAAEAKVPVVPVGLLGTGNVLPVDSHWPHRRRRVVLYAAPPIAPPAAGRAAGQEFILDVFSHIAGRTGQWPAFTPPEFAVTTTTSVRGSRAAAAHAVVERAFQASRDDAEALFRRALVLTRGVRDDSAVLERGRAAGQLVAYSRNPVVQLFRALQSKRLIWRSVRRMPEDALAWHVWASLMQRLPGWLGGDDAAAAAGHRMAVSITQDHRNILHAAMTARDAGRPHEAVRWLELFLQLDPAAASRLRIEHGEELLAQLTTSASISDAAR